jgi:Type I restriction modification DNA specificity domain.
MSIEAFPLNQICDILTGFQFRGKVEPDPTGKLAVIQMKDFLTEDKIIFDEKKLTRIKENAFSEKYIVRKNDVLVCGRGLKNFAVLIKKDMNNTIAASQFYILRDFKQSVSPGYVAAFLNLPKTQRVITTLRGGTGTQILNSKALGEIPIKLPELDIQHIIAKLFVLEQTEKMILKQLQIKHENLINNILENAMEGKRHE